MRWTNEHDLPEPLYRAIIDDPYDKGDAELSVTQLLLPPRIVLLQNLNAVNIVLDVVNGIPSLLGRVLHKIVEDHAPEGSITEERFFATVEGMKISGAVDLQTPLSDGTWQIDDYKLTGAYSVMDEKPEWEQQLNSYAYLARLQGREVSRLRIIAIIKDFHAKLVDKKPGYPRCQVVPVEIPVWSPEEQEAFVRGRVIIHKEAKEALDRNDFRGICTETERWTRGEAWALMKEGRKGAIKLYDIADDALAAAQAKGDGFYVEHRDGEPIRCAGDYCRVSRWCKQWRSDPRYTP